MSFAESFEDLKVWQRSMTLRASHPDNDRVGDFLLKNLEATREESSSRGLASSLPPTISET